MELTNHLKLEDQIRIYFACGWMNTEGAGWAFDHPDCQSWYSVAVDKAKQELASLIRNNRLDEDQQFSLFYALDAFYHEHYSQPIRNRWNFDASCSQCSELLSFEIALDGYDVFRCSESSLNGKEGKFNLRTCPPSILERIFSGDDYKSFIRQVALDGGQSKFANWLELMHSLFPCPACGEETTILST